MTPAQLSALRAACFLDANAAAFFVAPGNAAGLRAYLNGASGTNVWRTDAPIDGINDGIDYGKYTPSDAVPSADPALSIDISRMLRIQTKQMNLQNMLIGRATLNCSRPNVRGGLRDAVIGVPAGTAGALTAPGGASGANVLAACVRSGTRAEVMLAAAAQASDTTGGTTARVMTFEGEVTDLDAATLIYKDDGSIWTA